MPDLTDEDRLAIMEAIAPFATNSGSQLRELIDACYRAGLAAGRARAIEDCAALGDKGIEHCARGSHPDWKIRSYAIQDYAAAIRALNAASPSS